MSRIPLRSRWITPPPSAVVNITCKQPQMPVVALCNFKYGNSFVLAFSSVRKRHHRKLQKSDCDSDGVVPFTLEPSGYLCEQEFTEEKLLQMETEQARKRWHSECYCCYEWICLQTNFRICLSQRIRVILISSVSLIKQIFLHFWSFVVILQFSEDTLEKTSQTLRT